MKGNPQNYDDLKGFITIMKQKYPTEIINGSTGNEEQDLRAGAAIRFIGGHGFYVDLWPRTGTWLLKQGDDYAILDRGYAHCEWPHGAKLEKCFSERQATGDASVNEEPGPEAQEADTGWFENGHLRLPDPQDPDNPRPSPGYDDLESFKALRDRYAGSYTRYSFYTPDGPVGMTFGDDW